MDECLEPLKSPQRVCYKFKNCNTFLHMDGRATVGLLRQKISREMGLPAPEQVGLKCGTRYLRDEELIDTIRATVDPMPGGAGLMGGCNSGATSFKCSMPAPEFSLMHEGNPIFGKGIQGGVCGKQFGSLPRNRQPSVIAVHTTGSMCCSMLSGTREKPPVIQGFNNHVMDCIRQQREGKVDHGIGYSDENGWEVPITMLKKGATRTSFLDLLKTISSRKGVGLMTTGSRHFQGIYLAGAC